MLKLNGRRLILASASPRREQLMKLMGLEFEVVKSHLDEENESFAFPEVQVLELSERKAAVVAEKIADGLIIGADTVVALRDEILGKPKDKKDAKKMLRRLSGQSHSVYTGFTLIDRPSGRMYSDYEKTEVAFRELDGSEIEAYVKTESPMDKAGSYGIQDGSALFVKGVRGCFYNVVGLPITKLYLALKAFVKEIEGT